LTTPPANSATISVALAERMLKLKTDHAQAEAARNERLDKQIDALVYDLYGLTDEEIALVEGG
jgi:hypothetical protein